MTGFYDQDSLNPFRFEHPADKHADEGYLYVLDVSTGVIKAGMTGYPASRIPTHISAARSFGAEIVGAWVSDPHVNCRDTERELLAFCRERATGEPAAEHFIGLDFTQVVDAAIELPKRRWSLVDGPSLAFAPGAVRTLRRAHGWTVRAFAERAQISGGFLSKVERGVQGMTPDLMWRIADAFGVSLAALTIDPDAFNDALEQAFRCRPAMRSLHEAAATPAGGSGRSSPPGDRPT